MECIFNIFKKKNLVTDDNKLYKKKDSRATINNNISNIDNSINSNDIDNSINSNDIDNSINSNTISNDISNINIDMYYLLYKIKNTDILWIVKFNESYNTILENHKKIKDTNNEDYIVVKKTELYYNLKFKLFKQFNIFMLTNDCKIVYST